MEILNLEALHKVPEILEQHGSFPRRIGKTTYAIQCLLGALDVLEDETIIVFVNNHQQMDHFIHDFYLACEEEDLDVMYHEAFRRIWFRNNSNHVKFFTARSIIDMHPIDAAKEKSWNNFIIFDLNDMPAAFYHENLTIADAHVLDKYRDFLINGL